MAAEALKLSGQKLGIDVIIETQGGAGVENQLKQKDIDEAACVILAEGAVLDEAAAKKAVEQGITVLSTELPIFEAALQVYGLLG